MFILDDILLAPMKGLQWIAGEIDRASRQEQEDEADALRRRLSRLYMQLEAGHVTEEEFDEQEDAILARLDELEAEGAEAGADAGDDEEPASGGRPIAAPGEPGGTDEDAAGDEEASR